MNSETATDRRRRLARMPWWTTAEAAFMLDVTKSTVTRWCGGDNPIEHRRGRDEKNRARIVVNAAAARERWTSSR